MVSKPVPLCLRLRALINDRKTYNGATFSVTLLNATDYFPFGAEMRKGTVATSYRYGFNGKEQDKNGEFGSLNHYSSAHGYAHCKSQGERINHLSPSSSHLHHA